MIMRRNELNKKTLPNQGDMEDDSRIEASSLAHRNCASTFSSELHKVDISRKIWSSGNYNPYAHLCKYSCETDLVEIKVFADQLKKYMKKKNDGDDAWGIEATMHGQILFLGNLKRVVWKSAHPNGI